MTHLNSEEKLIEDRKKEIIHLFKSNKFFSVFFIISILSLSLSLITKAGAPLLFSPRTWFFLFIFSSISSILSYFKKYKYVFYPILAWIISISIEIRTLNLPNLKDVTTGNWTLGPDLDPFLFLRWAKYIVTHGFLMPIDYMRYVPLGFNVKEELYTLSYLIAYFHKALSIFGSFSVEYSAILFPVFMFSLSIIFFFLFVRKALYDMGEIYSNIAAIISSFFYVVFPVLLPRTIAGIPEKEAASFLFLFAAFYFFLCAWKSNNFSKIIIFSLLSSFATTGMALVWGGVIYLFLTISLASLAFFVFGKIDNKRVIIFSLWIVPSLFILNQLSLRFSFPNIINSISTQIPLFVLSLLIFNFIFVNFIKPKIKFYFLEKIPNQLLSLIIFVILAFILSIIILGPSFIVSNLSHLFLTLTDPSPKDRFGITVAENKVPYFNEWTSSFGPNLSNFPLTFWLFFFGLIAIFYFMVYYLNKKERFILTISFTYFISAIIFSRIEQNSLFNGSNLISQIFFFSGIFVFLGTGIYYLLQYHKLGKEINFVDLGIALIISYSFFALVSVRGAIRLVMMLAPAVSILIAFFFVYFLKASLSEKFSKQTKIILLVISIVIAICLIFSANSFYVSSSYMAKGYVPSVYTHQWQKAMSWVRETTPKNSVFAHWWDYGYWVQSIGERATILDGGNVIVYWDYLMGRYVLTNPNISDSLEFLYTHNATHLLIDPTDIGKYPAFSSIGSDINYDRYSWIVTFLKDPRQTKETKNSTYYVYLGGFVLDSDLSYNLNGTKIYLPQGEAGIGAIIIERDKFGEIIRNPEAIFVYKSKQYKIPLRYAFDNKLIDFNSGINAGVFIFPRLTNQIDNDGALLFLSNKTVNSLLAKLYLYDENNSYFKLAHSEDDYIVEQIKLQNPSFKSNFVYYNEFHGPIKIWEISYPSGIKPNPEYLNKSYPDIRLTKTK
ncbi:MAG: hypothetical protein N3D20_01800 [Candidatus Pacearchaeota archaeon]|nr:hypothetical protein [Candidatus Pacearchaeota archaeon]